MSDKSRIVMGDESRINFSVPAVRTFCEVFRQGVSEQGGPDQFFSNLSKDISGTLRKVLSDIPNMQIFKRLAADIAYRTLFFSHIQNIDDKEFIESFFRGWELWRYNSLTSVEDIFIDHGSFFDPLLNNAIPRTVNDVTSCVSILELENFAEDFRVKTVFNLHQADKNLGGPNSFIISSTLASFLETLRIMLNSILMTDRENELFKIPAGRNIIDDALRRVDTLQDHVKRLKSQFEKMKT